MFSIDDKRQGGANFSKTSTSDSVTSCDPDFDLAPYMEEAAGLDEIAQYAAGIGPWIGQIYQGRDRAGNAILSDLVSQAQQRGLLVHPYTFRRDELPRDVDSFTELLDIVIRQAGVDGLFTDFPDLVVEYLQRQRHSA